MSEADKTPIPDGKRRLTPAEVCGMIHRRMMLCIRSWFPRESAEDVAADIRATVGTPKFLAEEHWHDYARVARYIWQCFLNRRTNAVRASERENRRYAPLSEAALVEDTSALNPLEKMVMAEDAAELSSAIEDLPLRLKQALLLRHVEELGYDQIGEAMGISRKYAKSAVHRGLEMLRGALIPKMKGDNQ